MSWVATAIGGSAALGAGASIFGSLGASNAQQNATSAALNNQNQYYQGIVNRAQPFIDAGTSALPTLQSLVTPGPNQTATLNQTPGFQFLQDWGLKGIQNTYSGRGLGGNVLTAASDFAQQNALAKAWQPSVNNLMSLVGVGQSGLNTLSGAGPSFSGQNTGAILGGGNAQAAGITGAAAGFGNLGTSAGNIALLNSLTGGNLLGGTGGGAWGGGNAASPWGANANAPAYPNPQGGSWYLDQAA